MIGTILDMITTHKVRELIYFLDFFWWNMDDLIGQTFFLCSIIDNYELLQLLLEHQKRKTVSKP
jgi:hypothetical protein